MFILKDLKEHDVPPILIYKGAFYVESYLKGIGYLHKFEKNMIIKTYNFSDTGSGHVYFSNDKVYHTSIKGELFCLDLVTEKINLLPLPRPLFLKPLEKDIILFSNYEDKIRFILCYDLNKKIFLDYKAEDADYIHGGKASGFLTRNRTTLVYTVTKLENEKFTSHEITASNFTIKEIEYVAEYKDTIIAMVKPNEGARHWLCAIDINTGKILWEINTMYDENGVKKFGFFQRLSFYSKLVEDKILVLVDNKFAEIDLIVKKVTIYKIEVEAKLDIQIVTTTFMLNEGLIFFTAEINGYLDYYGAFDIQKREIKWHKKLDSPRVHMLTYAPVLNDDYMYIQDTGNTIYIFDRKEDGI